MSETVESDDRREDPEWPAAEESATERTLLRTDVGRALGEAGYGSVSVLSHETADRVLSPDRCRLLQQLVADPVESERALADRLGREVEAVHRDLVQLAQADLVRFEEDRPVVSHDTVVIEPLVAPAAAVPDGDYSVDDEP